MLSKLRDFYYIDQRSLLNYLSIIEDGILKTVQQSFTDMSPKHHVEVSAGELQKLLCKLGIPVPKLAYKRDGSNTVAAVQTAKEPTMESRFMKLSEYLEPVMLYIYEVTPEQWETFSIGQFITCKCKVRLPKAYEVSTMLSNAADFLTFAENLQLPVQDSAILEHGVKYGKKVLEKQTHHVLFQPLHSPLIFQFTGLLHQVYLLGTTLSDLPNGTYTITARIEHILANEEKYPIFDTMAPFFYPDKVSEQDCFVTAPTIVVKVLAIYR